MMFVKIPSLSVENCSLYSIVVLKPLTKVREQGEVVLSPLLSALQQRN